MSTPVGPRQLKKPQTWSLRTGVQRRHSTRRTHLWVHGRPSGGATRFGTVLETGVDVALPRRWALGGYVAWIAGGEVVSRQFAGDRLTFAFLELVKRVN